MSFIESIVEKDQIKLFQSDAYTLEIWNITIDGIDLRLKFWRVLNSDKTDLIKEMWLNEVRQLNKLRSVTNADKFLELLHDNFIDDEGCYCLLYTTNEETISLFELKEYIEQDRSTIISRKKKKLHWLHKDEIHEISSRVFLWKNVVRLIKGIEILHSQGIVHRNIDLENILYDNSTELDDTERFRLGGFELSLNISNLDSQNISYVNNDDNTVYSLYVDWEMLGLSILELLNIEKEQISESFLSYKEKNVIKLLLQRSRNEFHYIVDIEKVKIDISDIIKDLPEFRKDGITAPDFYITANCNPETLSFEKLRNLVRKFTNSDNMTNDEYLDFLTKDLNTSDCAIRQPRKNSNKIYMIRGKKLIYQIKSYQPLKSIQHSEEWQHAFIVNIFEHYPDWMDNSDSYEFSGKFNFLTTSKIKNKNYTLNSTPWSLIIAQFDEEQVFTDEEVECLQGLLLCHAIEIALMFTEKYLVKFKVLNKSFIENNSASLVDDGTEYISIIYKNSEDKGNVELSDALMIPKPLNRLLSFFSRDLQDSEKTWILEPEENEYLKRQVEIRFEGIIDNELVFSSKRDTRLYFSDSEKFMIYPSDHQRGSETQINRRTQSFYRLLEQRNLVSSLVDPSGKNRITRLKHNIEDSLAELDDSKAEVFKQLMSTQPNFFIEGPPGVGKTYLITTYINQIFKDEPKSKVLLSSQSHDTVKILAEEVKKKFNTDELIVINAFKENIDEPHIIEKISKPYINSFLESEMYKDALKNTDIAIKGELLKISKDGVSQSLFDSILKSANIIFTTTNNKIVEDMIKKSVYFDISVMEESAKVSGFELISPMLVSSKRVLIGDYLQLPAFLEQVIDRINRNYQSFNYKLIYQQLLKIRFRKDVFRSIGLEYIIDNRFPTVNPDHRERVMQSLSRYFSLFKSLSTDAREIKERGYSSFGDIINIQHRMHPHISKIVSKTVYNDRLLDNPELAEKFLAFKPVKFKDSKILGLNRDKAVIWVDIPDKNTDKKMIESLENDHVNYAEIKVVKELLDILELEELSGTDEGKLYKIQVLSPYKNQVKELNNSLRNVNFKSGFVFDKPLARTVDSFQGDEADIVVISLVRHNNYVPITKALGFLMDMRRMNVLLSRAKYKMIIVGCFKMFKFWSSTLTEFESSFDKEYNENSEFIKRFVGLCEPDYDLMTQSKNNDNTNYSYINFVSAKDFLEENNEL